MQVFQILCVAIIQGITEFLPVSSSGHLILLPALTGINDQGQLIDIAAHVGTLAAVLVYFRKDTVKLVAGSMDLLRARTDTEPSQLVFRLIISTIPVVIAGLILYLAGVHDMLRNMTVVGTTTLVFGLLLYVADRTGKQVQTSFQWNIRDAIILGLWQIIALIPGTSRSGIVITGGRFLGYRRYDAVRISMLMSIPTIASAGILAVADMSFRFDELEIFFGLLVMGTSFITALGALSLMMNLLSFLSFTPYVIYRIILGTILLIIALY